MYFNKDTPVCAESQLTSDENNEVILLLKAYFLEIAIIWFMVLKKMIPSVMAGVAIHISPRSFWASSSYAGPAFNIYTIPLSSVT